MAESIVVDAGGTEVPVSNPSKVYFKQRGETKLDLVEYYLAVGEPILRTLQGRPLLLERFPDGAGGKSWFQKRVPKGAPSWLQTTVVATPNGTTSDALVAADLAHLVWAVNQGCLGFHVWPTHADSPDVADELRIDLDPSPGVGFEEVREAALHGPRRCSTSWASRSTSRRRALAGCTSTSASSRAGTATRCGPRAIALARELERRHPDLITAQWWKEERGTRVFFDFNQNAPHKTVFGAWCVRPRVGGQVSTPIRWDELPAVDPDELTLATVPARVAADGDPWEGKVDHPQDLSPLLEWSARDLADGLMDAPWPPVYPKMPNEPPRVAPSRAKTQAKQT